MTACIHKDIFGSPNEGVHAYRLFGVAIVDVVLTIIASLIISFFVLGFPIMSLWTLLVLACAFGAGIIAHRIFCVKTRVDRWLFG